MAEENLRNKQMVRAAISLISEKFPSDYKRAIADASKEKEIHMEAEKQVADLFKVVDNVRRKDMKSWNAFAHFSKQRQEKIHSSLKMKTFKMEIKKSRDTSQVETTRSGKQFRPTIKLSSSADVAEASTLQMASIIIECVILVLELIGIDIPDDQEEVQKAIKIAVAALSKSQSLIDDVDNIRQANENGDILGVAKGIFALVIDLFEEGVFWDIVKALLSDMAWYDWILTAAKIAAFITALVATGGLAELGELVSILVDATFFLEKLVNMTSFKKIHGQM